MYGEFFRAAPISKPCFCFHGYRVRLHIVGDAEVAHGLVH